MKSLRPLIEHILPTSNMVERLFSRAKIIIADKRKSIAPYHLEVLLFLCLDKDLWDVVDIGPPEKEVVAEEGASTLETEYVGGEDLDERGV